MHVLALDYTAVVVSGKVGPVKPVNHTSWVAAVTPTDRPKSVRNRCLIELFVALFVLSLCPFDISVGVGAFVTGLGQISSFLSFSQMNGAVTSCRHQIITSDMVSANFFRCGVNHELTFSIPLKLLTNHSFSSIAFKTTV